jgi:glycosyltransferase involved in cell wall biosynthesis
MRRVLFLAYFFPPLGGGGVQRSAKFVKYLPALGYEPIVVTGPARRSTPWSPTDATLFDDIPRGTAVARIAQPEPAWSGRWRSRAERWLSMPQPFSRWWVRESVELGRWVGRDADLIYASMSPFESGEAAARLARELDKPWVADLRDPWALDEITVYPTLLHRRREASRMRRTLASAAAIVMNTPEAADQLRRDFTELRATPIVTIPNGYDGDDFASPSAGRTDPVFRIVHAGFAHTAPVARRPSIWLGGAVTGFDIMTRSHARLLDAVKRVLAAHPELRGLLEVHLAGFMYDEEKQRLGSSPVHAHGYLTHPETVALLRSADLLFLPMHDLPPGRRARTVPGKTYEYAATGRPILAAVPDGDARDLLSRIGTAFVCRPSDVETMERIILREVERKRHGGPDPEPNWPLIEQYERRALTGRLADVFDSMLAPAMRRSALEARTGNPSAAVSAIRTGAR